jgi:hypothetical protein
MRDWGSQEEHVSPGPRIRVWKIIMLPYDAHVVTVHVGPEYCYVSMAEAAGKMQSVEELEARMRQQGLSVTQQNNKNIMQSSSNKNTEEDLVAFKKLVRNL